MEGLPLLLFLLTGAAPIEGKEERGGKKRGEALLCHFPAISSGRRRGRGEKRSLVPKSLLDGNYLRPPEPRRGEEKKRADKIKKLSLREFGGKGKKKGRQAHKKRSRWPL